MAQTTTGPRAVTITCPVCARRNRVDLSRLAHQPRCGECRRPLLLDRPLQATETDLEATLATASVPVVVDFYADWCGPCRATAPALDALAGARAGQLLVLKVDTDRNPGAAARHGVRSIPTLIAFVGGREAARHVGLATPAQLASLVAAG